MLYLPLLAELAMLSPTWRTESGLSDRCARVARVFGVPICVTQQGWSKTCSKDLSKCNHIANVLAQLIDNDEDGTPDDPIVLKEMIDGDFGVFVPNSENENMEPPRTGNWQMSGLFESVPNSCDVPTNRGATTDRSTWPSYLTPTNGCDRESDATFEEVLHLITGAAGQLWPNLWGESFQSEAGKAVKAANGNCGWGYTGDWKNPSSSDCDGQYAYDDSTCDEGCLVVEGIYWASISYVGGLYTTTRSGDISREWLMATPDDGMPVVPDRVPNAKSLQAGSPALYALVSDTTSVGHAWLPAIMPDGNYKGPTLPQPPPPPQGVSRPPPPAQGGRPCGCEVDGVKFCNFDDGDSGTCESCSSFSNADACTEDGLPERGAQDCIARCFGQAQLPPPPPPPSVALPPPPPPPSVAPLPPSGLKVIHGSNGRTLACLKRGNEHEHIKAPFPTTTSDKTLNIAVQCCKVGVGGINGCVRYVDTNDDAGCMGGWPARSHTYFEAVTLCNEAGAKMNPPTRLELCDRTCSGQGCMYNHFPVFTSLPCDIPPPPPALKLPPPPPPPPPALKLPPPPPPPPSPESTPVIVCNGDEAMPCLRALVDSWIVALKDAGYTIVTGRRRQLLFDQ